MIRNLVLAFVVICGAAGAVLATMHPATACPEGASNTSASNDTTTHGT